MVRYISDCVGLFQSTSPQGERPRLKRVLQKIMNFNPRPRKGNDTHRYHSSFFYLISIHVPARGTTHILPCNILDRIISIHVPARGTTLLFNKGCFRFKFQSTSPQGERPTIDIYGNLVVGISIHVPARGTTSSISTSVKSGKFQSTSPQGERPWRL